MSLRVPFVRLQFVAVMVVAAGLTSGVRGASAIDTASEPAAAVISEVSESNEASTLEASAWSNDAVGSINPKVLKLALGASRCAMANGHVSKPGTLTIIDYSKPSTQPRMWVLDLNNRALLYEELVAHGQGSGGNMANAFSNTPDSHQTSIGLFVTDDTYVGRNGYSLRLNGLEKGFNDRARERAIVMHGAPYVNTTITKGLGRLGRSHGCPAVREPIARELIDTVKGGNLVFSYYPDAKWLETSKFLSCAS